MSKKKDKRAETPLMKQYNNIKGKYPDALLLFRVGDFYETFGEDAVKTSKILGIVLTKRKNGAASFVDLAGFPHHSLDTYLPKLVKAGQRVAICDQLEDPKLTKTIVKRGVTELVTPGVTFNENVLDGKENNFLACIHFQTNIHGIAFLDISTGEFLVTEGDEIFIEKLMKSFHPSEIIVQKKYLQHFQDRYPGKNYLNSFEEWIFSYDFTYELLVQHFKTNSLKGFGIEDLKRGTIAAGCILHYLRETHNDHLDHLTKLSRISMDDFVWLDQFTIRNLELLESLNPQAVPLVNAIDRTITPMGARLLRRWISLPIKNLVQLSSRYSVIDSFLENKILANKIRKKIKLIGDLERVIGRVAVGKVNPREVLQLKNALLAIEQVFVELKEVNNDHVQKLIQQLDPCKNVISRIENEIQPDPPLLISKGNVIRNGVSNDLDHYRNILFSGKDYLLKIQQREANKTGIPSLKIGYNNVFGYYLEVTHTHKEKVPEEWTRKQTLTNAERYITEELKSYEQQILQAEEKIHELEQQLYNELISSIGDFIKPIQINAKIISQLDVLLSFAHIAREHNYVKPLINNGYSIDIKKGRHPVIEQLLPGGEKYIANDVFLDNESNQILIITGPNMSGKSALLRQTALIVLLAQIGCYVPAKSASIGLVDKIFTRVGASDNLSLGESTFMVEMNETASILNNISDRSLILLDEIGRGTSTYDGISIAWAITEYLHEHPLFRAKVMFATHYHELNEMTRSFNRIKNFHISIKEHNQQIIFLRKLVPGGSEHSFGIHVAKMAGMPKHVIDRANVLLKFFEESHSNNARLQNPEEQNPQTDNFQLSFIQLDDPLLLEIKEEIVNLDINTLTPVEALMKLNHIKKLLDKK